MKKTASHTETKRIKRPGVHAKSGSSALKSSKLYKKRYKGQGK